MVSAVKWQAASTVTQIMTTQLDGLANDTISTASTEVDNSTNLDTFAWLELNVTFPTAPSDDSPSVDVYMTQAPDGTNYQDNPVSGGTDQGHLFAASFPVQKVTTAQRLVIGPIPLPPHKFKLFLDNQTGQAMNSTGNTLDIAVNNLEGQ